VPAVAESSTATVPDPESDDGMSFIGAFITAAVSDPETDAPGPRGSGIEYRVPPAGCAAVAASCRRTLLRVAQRSDLRGAPSGTPPFVHQHSGTRSMNLGSRHSAVLAPGVATALLLAGALLLGACTAAEVQPARQPVLAPTLEAQRSGTDALLIAVSVVDSAIVWVSGARGTWARSVDGGATWITGVVAGADSLQFRDVHALDAANAFLLSIGEGEQSRIYRTTDGGASWVLQFTNREPRGFFDCFGFWDARAGFAFSDSFDGRFLLIETADGGGSWTEVAPERLPAAQEGEGSFAASGTCVAVHGDSLAWIGTGASAAGARVLRTTDRGRTWVAASTPIVAGSAAGIASVAFRDARHGAALGGDIALPDSVRDNVALTSDGGATWTLGGRPSFTGAVYGGAWVPGAPQPTLVAVGPRGVSVSADGGRVWAPVDTLNHWGIGMAGPGRGWLVGPGGRITRIAVYR
jgi:photosystem II stability/assembly factor-like uncharacterized protein